jgi:hypothetical protein
MWKLNTGFSCSDLTWLNNSKTTRFDVWVPERYVRGHFDFHCTHLKCETSSLEHRLEGVLNHRREFWLSWHRICLAVRTKISVRAVVVMKKTEVKRVVCSGICSGVQSEIWVIDSNHCLSNTIWFGHQPVSSCKSSFLSNRGLLSDFVGHQVFE